MMAPSSSTFYRRTRSCPLVPALRVWTDQIQRTAALLERD
jgi:hypothetical protein